MTNHGVGIVRDMMFRLMVEKESGYFLRAFWQGLLGHDVDEGVWEELREIARLAGEAPARFFPAQGFSIAKYHD